ncbi:NAD(P)H-quinone oxidoreductase subunit L [Leptolyngbya sp. PCC 6406]|uniref:NAD(P)H-quinone oxidoreductase subunit L n=1 Tax=Leptolyngbya sp. PCC 6406 TaxID=1173264 RepID=UPI0002ABB3BD|nr:NAD(P)H-quinone oxidoreductase subunit L [Leptolyngbya sp. PCC 6406]
MSLLSNFNLSPDTLLALATYGVLGGAYLLVVPAALLFYLKVRWHTMGSVERTLVYGLVFAFFPGMLLLSPFVNFRPQPRPLKP